MPNGDPQDGFLYPTLTLMIYSYIYNAESNVHHVPATFGATVSYNYGTQTLQTIQGWSQLCVHV